MAGVYDFVKDRHIEGDYWSIPMRRRESLTGPGIDLTGLTPKMMIRDAEGIVLLTVNAAAWTASPTTTGARIPPQVLADDLGRVHVFVSSIGNTVPHGVHSYDVQLTDVNGNVRTFLRGRFIVTAQVTT
jgi:hypothetical protein